jgi:proteasome lid subunit RPN8/RPN11
MNPQQQLDALLDMEQNGWDLLAIYHSHPHGPELPSHTDILEHFYPDALCMIWSKGTAGWVCRAFQIQNGNLNNIEIRYEE